MRADRVRRHWLGELMPLWRTHGVDRERGGFLNRLHHDLKPSADPDKRLLVQCRLIWSFSVAAEHERDGEALETAGSGFQFLCSALHDERAGGFFLTCTPAGEPLDRSKDLYAHAFVILALARYARVSGRAEPLEQAKEVFGLLDEHLRDAEHGGFLESADEHWKPRRGPRRQNPHMHLLEALQELHATDPDPRESDECARLVALFRERFFDAEKGTLGEHFDARWRPLPGAEGAVVEPGHHYEWAWLLARQGACAEEAERLFRFAEAHGVDDDGGVFDELDRSGRVVRDSKRLWPQTERLHALAARARSEADREALAAALADTFARYTHPEHHGWREQADREGRITSELMNATSVYHVTGALEAILET